MSVHDPNLNITSFERTRSNCKTNAHNRWSKNPALPGFSAQERFAEEFFHVKSKPKFRFKKSAKVFTIGSCFARNIERQLRANQVRCLTENPGIPIEYYAVPSDPRAALNKFNIPSMLDDMLRTFEPTFSDKDRFIEAGPEGYFDPSTTNLKILPIEALEKVSAAVRAVNLRIQQADVIIITLGLVEMWRDRISGLYLNTAPAPAVIRHEQIQLRKTPGAVSRFEHMRPGYAFVRDSLFKLIDVMLQVAPSAKVVISVSPVPLQTTMLEDDIVCSSVLSKALLRAAAEEARATYEAVDYFPSFEMVTHSPRAVTWLEDQVHVNPDLVAKVTGTFMEEWFED